MKALLATEGGLSPPKEEYGFPLIKHLQGLLQRYPSHVSYWKMFQYLENMKTGDIIEFQRPIWLLAYQDKEKFSLCPDQKFKLIIKR